MYKNTILSFQGYCPICRKETNFITDSPDYRNKLICKTCPNGSVPRERALALVLFMLCPNWKHVTLHESSPINRGLSVILKKECSKYIGTQFFEDKPLGTIIGEWQNENLEKLTFDDESIDITISMDVMEHIFNPEISFKEIYRTLRSKGYYICTFPIYKNLVAPLRKRAFLEKGNIVYCEGFEPIYHGNPINFKGSLVTIDYGYEIHNQIVKWAPFDVSIIRFSDKYHGIIGDFTEVIVCKKN